MYCNVLLLFLLILTGAEEPLIKPHSECVILDASHIVALDLPDFGPIKAIDSTPEGEFLLGSHLKNIVYLVSPKHGLIHEWPVLPQSRSLFEVQWTGDGGIIVGKFWPSEKLFYSRQGELLHRRRTFTRENGHFTVNNGRIYTTMFNGYFKDYICTITDLDGKILKDIYLPDHLQDDMASKGSYHPPLFMDGYEIYLNYNFPVVLYFRDDQFQKVEYIRDERADLIAKINNGNISLGIPPQIFFDSVSMSRGKIFISIGQNNSGVELLVMNYDNTNYQRFHFSPGYPVFPFREIAAMYDDAKKRFIICAAPSLKSDEQTYFLTLPADVTPLSEQ